MTSTSADRNRRTGLAPLALAALLALPAGAMAQATGSTTGSTAAPAASTAPTTSTQAAPAAPATPVTTPAPRGDRAHRAESDVVERRISSLHSRLKITPAQEQQWNAFADVMRANAQAMDQTYASREQQVQQMSAVQNMQSYAQMAQEHAQDVQKLVPAFQTLYDALSPEQKKIADQTFRSYAERGAERHGHGHG
jgi:hypothetical protein